MRCNKSIYKTIRSVHAKPSKFKVYVITARKVGEPAPEIGSDYFRLDTDKAVTRSKPRKNGSKTIIPAHPRMEICTGFAFQDPKTGAEDVERRVSRYLHGNEKHAAEARTVEVPAARDAEYVVINNPKQSLTIRVPKSYIDQLRDEVRQYNGVTRSELRALNPRLHTRLKHFHLLKELPAKRQKKDK